MASRNISGQDANAIVGIRGELQALRNEVASLRGQLARITGADSAPVQAMPQVSRPLEQPWEQDPRHDPEVVDALLRGDDPRPALRRARDRIADQITAKTGNRPASIGEFDLGDARRRDGSHQQRQAQAAAQQFLDLTGSPMGPGGVMERNVDTGQVSITFPAQPSCPNGHAAERPDDRYCTVCDSPVAAPSLGEQWADELEQARQQNQRIAAGLSEEG
jgi:hypothetical protein